MKTKEPTFAFSADDFVAVLRGATIDIEARRVRAERAAQKEIARAALRGTVLASRETFAAMIDMSPKQVDRMIKRGLPSVGTGRARRIDVEQAVAWIRNNPESLNDKRPEGVIEAARAAASRDVLREQRRAK